MKIKFPYILDYNLFERVDVGYAEELLGEYVDFYEYNKTFVAQSGGNVHESFDSHAEDVPNDAATAVAPDVNRNEIKRAEHNRSVSVAHFEKLFGSLDFAEACLVGLKIDFDELQKVLVSENRAGVPITESALNAIAPKLRAFAGILLLAERIIAGLIKLEASEDTVAFAKDGFALLLERLANEAVIVPEFYKTKKELGKMKTVKAYIDYCEKLFFRSEG